MISTQSILTTHQQRQKSYMNILSSSKGSRPNDKDEILTNINQVLEKKI